jgi:hypothetical protein
MIRFLRKIFGRELAGSSPTPISRASQPTVQDEMLKQQLDEILGLNLPDPEIVNAMGLADKTQAVEKLKSCARSGYRNGGKAVIALYRILGCDAASVFLEMLRNSDTAGRGCVAEALFKLEREFLINHQPDAAIHAARLLDLAAKQMMKAAQGFADPDTQSEAEWQCELNRYAMLLPSILDAEEYRKWYQVLGPRQRTANAGLADNESLNKISEANPVVGQVLKEFVSGLSQLLEDTNESSQKRNGIPSDQSNERLISELIAIGKTEKFISSNPTQPEKYDDRYNHIRTREIGELLDKSEGLQLMRDAHNRVNSALGTVVARELESAWEDIGDWRG